MAHSFQVEDFNANRVLSAATETQARELAVLVARKSGHALVRTRAGRLVADYFYHASALPVPYVSIVDVG
jgi:stage III sporulation protein SpoIIIAA